MAKSVYDKTSEAPQFGVYSNVRGNSPRQELTRTFAGAGSDPTEGRVQDESGQTGRTMTRIGIGTTVGAGVGPDRSSSKAATINASD